MDRLNPRISLDLDVTLAADSNERVPSQHAVKTYVDASGGGSGVSSPGCATNYAIGTAALDSATSTGCQNVAIGNDAATGITTGDWNIAIGDSALQTSTTGVANVAIGVNAMLSLTTGYWNTALGAEALYSATTANGNVAIGGNSAWSTTGVNNCVVGTDAFYYNTTGIQNTCLGTQAGNAISAADNNVCVGRRAAYIGGPIGSGNTILGANTPSLASGLVDNVILVSGSTIRAQYDGTRWTFLGPYINVPTAKTPASATAAGATGDICWDSSYVYVCVAANTWKRTALTTW